MSKFPYEDINLWDKRIRWGEQTLPQPETIADWLRLVGSDAPIEEAADPEQDDG